MIEFGLNRLSANPSSRHSSIRINDVLLIGKKLRQKKNFTYTQNPKKKKKMFTKEPQICKICQKDTSHIIA